MSKQSASDASQTIGTIIGEGHSRDAIHVAVMPAKAAYPLKPGEHVGPVAEGVMGICDDPIGIVDPFLPDNVRGGQWFWLCIYPRRITSLRHVWTHPNLPDEVASPVIEPVALTPVSEAAQNWLAEFAISFGESYDELIDRANAYLDSGEFWVGGDDFQGLGIPDGFWDQFEKATGRIVSSNRRDDFFSCSC
jgi:hypothetical protein